ncbi:hypothetical protein KUW15_03905 [Qipengyuania aquimaris]|uniref:hypothetical protein n=1 Tax=Qipengyuania aquimaris TaxID=255984 RepID=UPI001C97C693|nr:hypothetical protein [Qipengyuania aquimaris]MBY6127854.1 hypothetical protein [Qipengyuania aquimaris]
MKPRAPVEGWVKTSGTDDRPAKAVTPADLLDIRLCAAGWDGQPDTRDAACLNLLGQLERLSTLSTTTQAMTAHDSKAERARRGGGGKAAKRAEHAAMRARIEEAVDSCRAEMVRVTVANCMRLWPTEHARPHRNTIRRHLKGLGLLS